MCSSICGDTEISSLLLCYKQMSVSRYTHVLSLLQTMSASSLLNDRFLWKILHASSLSCLHTLTLMNMVTMNDELFSRLCQELGFLDVVSLNLKNSFNLKSIQPLADLVTRNSARAQSALVSRLESKDARAEGEAKLKTKTEESHMRNLIDPSAGGPLLSSLVLARCRRLTREGVQDVLLAEAKSLTSLDLCGTSL